MSRNPNGWIFENGYLDFSWLFLPGFIAVALSFFITNGATPFFRFYAFLTIVLLDAGHCYTTLWRTYFNSLERKRRPWTYALVPIVIFTILAITSREPSAATSLLAVFLFIRCWHNVRQSYGISKWYQQKNQRASSLSDFFLYALSFLPFVIMISGHSLAKEKFAFLAKHGDQIQSVVYPIYWALCALWVVFEILRWKRHRELNRLLSILFPAITYGFILMNNVTLKLGFALMISHAVAYNALTHVALKKTKSFWVDTKVKIAGVILIPAFLAVIEHFPVEILAAQVSYLNALSAVGYTVFFSHVYYDTFLWRRTHPESSLIYS